MDDEYFTLTAKADQKADLTPLHELASAAEGWLLEAQQIVGQKGTTIEEFTTWVGALNAEAHNTIFASPAFLDELMEKNFNLASLYTDNAYDLAKTIDARTAESYNMSVVSELGELMHQWSQEPEVVLYENVGSSTRSVLVMDTFTEAARYFARHPEKLHDLHSRKFEELIRDFMRDQGFDAELTKATRDGGRDIFAYMKNQVTSFLLFVECKRWSPHTGVGIGIVQRLAGTCWINGADKGMVVTTSYFTKPALEEQGRISSKMQLADYDRLKEWFGRYK